MIKRLCLLLCALTLSLPLLSPAAAALPIPPFDARYTVYGAGLPLGEGRLILEQPGNGRYRMQSRVEPTGLAAMLVSEAIDEQVEGRFADGRPYPSNYRRTRSKSDGKEETVATFDWRAETLKARHDDKRATLPLKPGVVDPLSLHLLVMHNLQQGRTQGRYTLLDETELKTYQVSADGEETLDTPLGQLRTLKVSRRKPGSSRVTTLWFAPELNYLLVQVAQRKNGSEVLRMSIQEVQGLPTTP